MDGINLPLTEADLHKVLNDEVLTIPIPDAGDPEGPPVTTVFVRLDKGRHINP